MRRRALQFWALSWVVCSMALVEKPQSFDQKWGGDLRWARRAALGAWVCGLTSVGLAWAQARWYVFHPHYLPLCLLFAGLGVSTCVALLGCLWRFAQGPRRVRAAILAVVAMLPAGFWAYVGVTAQRNHQRRWIPNTFAMRLAQVMGAAFMRADVDLRYRHQLESKRLVMFYDSRNPEHPERVNRPERDLAVMDKHLARLEQMLGGTISSKVYWIRGRVLGLEGLSFHGLSLGSAWSPGVGGSYRTDRHELAHAALDWFRFPGSDPPCLLGEGWAMSQCGDGWLELARAAAGSRRENPALGVRELLGPDWYHQDSGPVYSVGGAFVDFLVRTRGGARFRRFCVECQPDTFEAKCREIFETDLDDLEAEFWEDVQKAVAAIHDDMADSAQTGPGRQSAARIRRTDGRPIPSRQTTTTSTSRRRAVFKSASRPGRSFDPEPTSSTRSITSQPRLPTQDAIAPTCIPKVCWSCVETRA
jgi:hypothetical protein